MDRNGKLLTLPRSMRPKRFTLILLLLALMTSAVLLMAAEPSAMPALQSGDNYELRCYDVRAGADPTDTVIVHEGDDFVINVKYRDYSFLDNWGVTWDTQWYGAGNATQTQRGGTATENKDFAPEHNEYHSKSSSNNMNHTFHTIEDDLFEGIETYWAGFATGTLLVFTDGFYCPVQIWDDDVLRLRSSEFNSKPVDGKTYRAGETIELAVKYNGKVTIGERNAPVYIPLEVGDADTGHVRKAMYLRGAETDTLVFGYTVQPDDLDTNNLIVLADDKKIVASNWWEDGPEGYIYGVGTNGHHFTKGNAPYGPLGAKTTDWIDGRPYVKSLAITSSPEDGAAYRTGETIELTATFDQNVDVDGQVGVSIRVGTENTWRGAWYSSGSGTDTLVFGYTVQEDDSDSDGINIDSGGIDGDGNTYGFTGTGTIKAAGTNVERNPSYSGRYDTGDPVNG